MIQFLRDLSWTLYHVAVKFGDIADSVNDVWLIGDYLASPFSYISTQFYNADTQVWYFADGLETFWNSYDYLINHSGWQDVLANFAYFCKIAHIDPVLFLLSILIDLPWWLEWVLYYPLNFVYHFVRLVTPWISGFLDNPQGFIVAKLNELGTWIYLILYYPQTFVNYYVRLLAPWISGFLDNPLGFIVAELNELGSWIYWLLYYPAYFVDYYFRSLTPWTGSLLDNPKGFIFEQLRLVSPELANFLIDPVTWVKNKIAESFGLPYGFWGNSWYFTFNALVVFINDNLLLIAEPLKNLIVKIVLFFM